MTEHALIMCREPGRHSTVDKGHEWNASLLRLESRLELCTKKVPHTIRVSVFSREQVVPLSCLQCWVHPAHQCRGSCSMFSFPTCTLVLLPFFPSLPFCSLWSYFRFIQHWGILTSDLSVRDSRYEWFPEGTSRHL